MTSTSSLRLKSSDGKTYIVDQDVIKEMVTIQNMLDSLGDGEDTDGDETIPIYTINGEILDKVIQWTKYSHNSSAKTDFKCWSEKFLLMNIEDAFQLMEAADYLEINSLLCDGEHFIDKHFEEVIATKGFKNLPQHKLELLLARDTLNVPNEEVVFESLLAWMSSDPKERPKSVGDLFPLIRANFLSGQFIGDKLKHFIIEHNKYNLFHQLNFSNKTIRDGYDQCIIALHEKDGTRQLKYLDTKVYFKIYIQRIKT